MLLTAPLPLALSVLALVVRVRSTSPKAPAAPGGPPVGHPSWALGLRLYRALRSSDAPPTPNTLFSPLLLASSLEALGEGAGGTTASQLQELLRPSAEVTEVEEKMEEALIAALRSVREANGTGFWLRSSLALLSSQAAPLEQGFLQEADSRFGLEHVALGPGGHQANMDALHTWAQTGMGGVETPRLQEDLVDQSGSLILASALHFKGLWERGFDQDDLDLRTFLGTKYTKVPMMHRSGVHRHYEDVENMVQVLELGLGGGRASLLLLLPFHVEKLARLESLLSAQLLGRWLDRLAPASMAISMPRIQLSRCLSLQIPPPYEGSVITTQPVPKDLRSTWHYVSSLTPSLASKQLAVLGLTDAWDQKAADFSGLSGQGKSPLHLGAVFHWASLELGSDSVRPDGQEEDEEVEKPKRFYADHSFIVLVRDNSTGALLLIGALDQAEGPGLHDEL